MSMAPQQDAEDSLPLATLKHGLHLASPPAHLPGGLAEEQRRFLLVSLESIRSDLLQASDGQPYARLSAVSFAELHALLGPVGLVDSPEGSGLPTEIVVGDIVISPLTRDVLCGDRKIALTNQEFVLISVLGAKPLRVWSSQQLLDEIWGEDHYGGAVPLRQAICRLRKKLTGSSVSITAVRGYGFKLTIADG